MLIFKNVILLIHTAKTSGCVNVPAVAFSFTRSSFAAAGMASVTPPTDALCSFVHSLLLLSFIQPASFHPSLLASSYQWHRHQRVEPVFNLLLPIYYLLSSPHSSFACMSPAVSYSVCVLWLVCLPLRDIHHSPPCTPSAPSGGGLSRHAGRWSAGWSCLGSPPPCSWCFGPDWHTSVCSESPWNPGLTGLRRRSLLYGCRGWEDWLFNISIWII